MVSLTYIGPADPDAPVRAKGDSAGAASLVLDACGVLPGGPGSLCTGLSAASNSAGRDEGTAVEDAGLFYVAYWPYGGSPSDAETEVMTISYTATQSGKQRAALDTMYKNGTLQTANDYMQPGYTLFIGSKLLMTTASLRTA